MMTDKTPLSDFLQGGENFRPIHHHLCQAGEKAEVHSWRCNSPYCEAMERVCVMHGGSQPISIGEEPWRGK